MAIAKTLPDPIDQIEAVRTDPDHSGSDQIRPQVRQFGQATGFPTRTIMGYLRNNSVLRLWQADRARTTATFREILDANVALQY